ncbi:MAG: hypothetical protein ACOC5T_04845 [Elusimicrobiota bacterium]
MGRATTKLDKSKKRKRRRSNNIVKIGKNMVKLSYVISPKALAKFGRRLTYRKKDLIFMITGYPGEGKSVLAIRIARHFDKRFNYDRNLIYSRSELMEKIENFPPSAFIIDEAINILYKREWNKGAQKDMIKLLNICRSKGHMLIFVQPDFEDMDKDIRKKRLRLWIDVIKRGVGVMYKPIKSLGGGSDPWNLDKNNTILKSQIKKLGIVEGYLEGAAMTENFQNIITWTNLEDEDYKRYDEVKDKRKYADEESDFLTVKEAEKLVRKKTFDLLARLKDGKYLKIGCYSLIANFFNVGTSAVSSYMKDARVRQNLNNPNASKDEQEEGALRI